MNGTEKFLKHLKNLNVTGNIYIKINKASAKVFKDKKMIGRAQYNPKHDVLYNYCPVNEMTIFDWCWRNGIKVRK